MRRLEIFEFDEKLFDRGTGGGGGAQGGGGGTFFIIGGGGGGGVAWGPHVGRTALERLSMTS